MFCFICFKLFISYNSSSFKENCIKEDLKIMSESSKGSTHYLSDKTDSTFRGKALHRELVWADEGPLLETSNLFYRLGSE